MLKVYIIAQQKIRNLREQLSQNESGAALVEYALLIGMMSVAVIAAVKLLTPKINTAFTNVGTHLTTLN
jgi:Flp pilus assembly pilin Flp